MTEESGSSSNSGGNSGNSGGSTGSGGKGRGRNRNRNRNRGGRGKGGGQSGEASADKNSEKSGEGGPGNQGNRNRGGRGGRSGQNKQSGSGGAKKSSGQNTSGNKGRKRGSRGTEKKAEQELTPVIPREIPPQRYAAIFFDNFANAKKDFSNLQSLKDQVDQLNIIIKEEGNMDDAELLPFGKIYAGEAWNLIHERRRDAGWYEISQPTQTVMDFVLTPAPVEAES